MTAQERYSETFRKNIERMEILRSLIASARKHGDNETARRYRAEYTDLKAEIDAAVFGVILNK